MRSNRTFVFIVIVLFSLGLGMTNLVNAETPDIEYEASVSDEEKPGNDYHKRTVVEETSNLFVRIARLCQSILNASINIFVNLIQRIFGVFFGT